MTRGDGPEMFWERFRVEVLVGVVIVLACGYDVPEFLCKFDLALGKNIGFDTGAKRTAGTLAYEREMVFSLPVGEMLDAMVRKICEALLQCLVCNHLVVK